MPPRHVYWTIIAGGQPTAFRAAEREELLPTLKQLQARHPDATMMWFARGKLWPTKEAADFSQRQEQHRGGERRGKDWRPGGEHKDPRDQFKVPRDVKRARFAERARRDRMEGEGPSRNRERVDSPLAPPKPPTARSGEGGRPTAPRSDRPHGDRPFVPKGDRPQGDRRAPPKPRSSEGGTFRPREDRPQGDRPFRPKGDRPQGDRPFRPREDRPQGDRSFRPRSDRPQGDRLAPPKPRSGEGGPFRPKADRQGSGGGFKPRTDRPHGDRDRPKGPADGFKPRGGPRGGGHRGGGGGRGPK